MSHQISIFLENPVLFFSDSNKDIASCVFNLCEWIALKTLHETCSTLRDCKQLQNAIIIKNANFLLPIFSITLRQLFILPHCTHLRSIEFLSHPIGTANSKEALNLTPKELTPKEITIFNELNPEPKNLDEESISKFYAESENRILLLEDAIKFTKTFKFYSDLLWMLQLIPKKVSPEVSIKENKKWCDKFNRRNLIKSNFKTFFKKCVLNPHAFLEWKKKNEICDIKSIRFKLALPLLEIPNQVFNCSSLNDLTLRHAKIYSLPDAISRLTQLTILNISNNYIRYIPNSITQLTRLKTLNISKNFLTDLPKSMLPLTNLNHLDIRYNLLKSLPNGLSRLTQLQVLRVSDDVASLKILAKKILENIQANRFSNFIKQENNTTESDSDSDLISDSDSYTSSMDSD